MKKPTFLPHEVAEIMKRFPYESAPLKNDLDPIELEALTTIGRLKHKAYKYLGLKSF